MKLVEVKKQEQGKKVNNQGRGEISQWEEVRTKL